MDFTWDEEKSEVNLRARGFDFAFARRIFASAYLEREDTRRDYGERRMIAVGCVDGLYLTVVYTDRAAPDGRILRRIISGRKSNGRERETYAERIRG
jgi:hypothetical protein